MKAITLSSRRAEQMHCSAGYGLCAERKICVGKRGRQEGAEGGGEALKARLRARLVSLLQAPVASPTSSPPPYCPPSSFCLARPRQHSPSAPSNSLMSEIRRKLVIVGDGACGKVRKPITINVTIRHAFTLPVAFCSSNIVC